MNRQDTETSAAVASTRVAAAAEALWEIKLEHPYTRLSNGLEVRTIRPDTRANACHDAARATGLLASLEDVDEHLLVHSERLTLAFVRHDLRQMLDAEKTWLSTSAVTPYSSMIHIYLAQQLLAKCVVDSSASYERVQGLWRDLAQGIVAVSDRIAAQARLGRYLACPALKPAIASWDGIRKGLCAILDASAARGNGAWAAKWSVAAVRVREHYVNPALDMVIRALSDPAYLAAAPDAVGLVHQPGGEDTYRRLIRTHLTMDDDPGRIHRVGLEQVSELAERMREVRARLGFQGSEADFHLALKHDAKVVASTSDEVAARYQRCLHRIEPLLSSCFARLSASPYRVERLKPEQEAGMTYGYYDKPAVMGDHGVYYYNASDLQNRSQLQVAALIYHELMPGHHLHLTRQMELTHLPALRRNGIELTAFNEGWAEYASGLAGEIGMYDDPYDHYGRLAHERFVAQRLVVDTGMNALGWTLERARAYMAANTLEGDAQVNSETLRYSTDMPGQALAYRLGYLHFMQMREDTRTRCGPAFDLRDFHEAVLGEGALPLGILAEHVRAVMP